MVIATRYSTGVIEHYKGCSTDEHRFVCPMEDEPVDPDENVYCCRTDMCNFVAITLPTLTPSTVYKQKGISHN